MRSAARTGGSSLRIGRRPSSSIPWSSVRARWIVPYAIRRASARSRAGRSRTRRDAPAHRSLQAAQELVVAHPTTSFGLDFQEPQLSVRYLRAPDDHATSVQLRLRADMRRERAASVVQLLGRAAEVEPAVFRGQLLGVGDAVLRLWLEARLRQSLVQELGGEVGRAGGDEARVLVGADGKALLRGDRAGVELGRRAVDRDPGLRLAC